MSRPSRALRSTLLLPLAVLLGVLALSATGCSSDNADKASVPEAGRAGAPVPGAAPAADVAGAPAAPKEGRPPDTARSLVHTAQLDLRVDDVARAGGGGAPAGAGGGGGGGGAGTALRTGWSSGRSIVERGRGGCNGSTRSFGVLGRGSNPRPRAMTVSEVMP